MTSSFKQQLMHLMAHAIKSPVGINKWHIEMLLSEDYGSVTGEQVAVLQEMQKENAKILSLLKEFLEISLMPEMNALNLQPIALADMCRDVVAELDSDVRKHNHNVSIHIEGDYQLSANASILKLILHTLISNALNYTPDKGKIHIGVEKTDKEYIISVMNSHFITEKEQAHIYQQGQRTEYGRSTNPDGTGMGLYLVKSIVEQTGGKTWFTSQPEEGTVFYVAYPIEGMTQ